jgi:hypothetical protein
MLIGSIRIAQTRVKEGIPIFYKLFNIQYYIYIFSLILKIIKGGE